MKVNVMYRAQCLAAYLGYGPDFDAENITEPTLIICSMILTPPNLSVV